MACKPSSKMVQGRGEKKFSKKPCGRSGNLDLKKGLYYGAG